MADPSQLRPSTIRVDGPEYAQISGWPYRDSFVGRLLRDDIPRRVQNDDCVIWIYRNPDDQIVGFGTIVVGDEYRDYTGGLLHPYIPLLAVEPSSQGRG